MSRGTLSPERSSHRRMVSADECCVVRSRIYQRQGQVSGIGVTEEVPCNTRAGIHRTIWWRCPETTMVKITQIGP